MSVNPPARFLVNGLGPGLVRLDAWALADTAAVVPGPAAVLLRLHDTPAGLDAEVLAAGSRPVVDRVTPSGTPVYTLPEAILTPGLINAHAHLDLTHVGPRPFDQATGFSAWLDMVRKARAERPEEITSSVQRGIELSLRGGTVGIGDIAGAPRGTPAHEPRWALQDSPLHGQSFLEFFALGRGEARGLERLNEAAALAATEARDGTRVCGGLQPHAPYSVSRRGYAAALEWAERSGLRVSTHLSESPEEVEFIAHARGHHQDFLERLGLWDDSLRSEFGLNATPVEHLEPILSRRPMLVAHVNFATDNDLHIIANTRTTVAYCPRASMYFGYERVFGPHRYREMLARGICVALGTDSIINLGSPTDRISVFDEMSMLFQRDGTDPQVLLRMATVNGAAALGLPANTAELRAGSRPMGIVAMARTPREAVILRGVHEVNSCARADVLEQVLGAPGSAPASPPGEPSQASVEILFLRHLRVTPATRKE